MIAGLVLWVACSGAPEPGPPVDAPAPDAVADADSEPSGDTTAGQTADATVEAGSPQLIIQYEGVAPLYRGFFNDARAGAALAEAAAPCVGNDVYLYVSYDNDERKGRMTLRVEPDVAACRPVPTETGWDLSPAVPLSSALATFRDTLAATYDFRISSFEVQVTYRAPDSSLCTLKAEGAHPPDGRSFAACVREDLNTHCGTMAADGTTLALDASTGRALRGCFTRP